MSDFFYQEADPKPGIPAWRRRQIRAERAFRAFYILSGIAVLIGVWLAVS